MAAAMDKTALMAQAQQAALRGYAPYSGFSVGAALLFDDGTVICGSNFENASYGLSLCAETAAVVNANQAGYRKGLVAVAVTGGKVENGQFTPAQMTISPCGRCRQILNELADLGENDPIIHMGKGDAMESAALSMLLPLAFGPKQLQ